MTSSSMLTFTNGEESTFPSHIATRVRESNAVYPGDDSSSWTNRLTPSRVRLFTLEPASKPNTLIEQKVSQFKKMRTTINPREPSVIHFNATKGLLWGEVMVLSFHITVHPVWTPQRGDPEWKQRLGDYMEASGEGWNSVFQVNLRTTSYEFITDKEGVSYYDAHGKFSGAGGGMEYLMMVTNSTMLPEGHVLTLDLQYQPSDEFISFFPDNNDTYLSLYIEFYAFQDLWKAGGPTTVKASDLPIITNYSARWYAPADLIGGRVLTWFTYWPNQSVTLNVTQVHDMWHLEALTRVNATRVMNISAGSGDEGNGEMVTTVLTKKRLAADNARLGTARGGDDVATPSASSPTTSPDSIIVFPGTQIFASYFNPGNSSAYRLTNGSFAYEAGPPKFMISTVSSTSSPVVEGTALADTTQLVQFVLFMLVHIPELNSPDDVYPKYGNMVINFGGSVEGYIASAMLLLTGVAVLKRHWSQRRSHQLSSKSTKKD